MNFLVSNLERASRRLAQFSGAAVVLLAAGFIAALILQVVFRYVFDSPLSWSEELATFLFVWATMLSASCGVRNAEHLRLTFLSDLLPMRPRLWLEVVCQVLVTVFGVFLVFDGWRLASLVWGNTSAAIGYPAGYLYLSVPVSGLLIAMHASARIGVMLRDQKSEIYQQEADE